MPLGVSRDNRTLPLKIQILKSDIREYKIRMPETWLKGTKSEQAQDKSGLGDMDRNQSELLEIVQWLGVAARSKTLCPHRWSQEGVEHRQQAAWIRMV